MLANTVASFYWEGAALFEFMLIQSYSMIGGRIMGVFFLDVKISIEMNDFCRDYPEIDFLQSLRKFYG